MGWLKFQQINGIWRFGKSTFTDIVGGLLAMIIMIPLLIVGAVTAFIGICLKAIGDWIFE